MCYVNNKNRAAKTARQRHKQPKTAEAPSSGSSSTGIQNPKPSCSKEQEKGQVSKCCVEDEKGRTDKEEKSLE